jgi:RNA polymerase sigma-70 factor (ECF subfamily)
MALAFLQNEPEMLEETRPTTGPESIPPQAQSDWARLVQKIQRGDSDALTELYHVFARGVKFYMYRQLGPQDLDDRLHDAFLVVVQAIQRGDLRDPDRLMGFVRTIVRRQVATRIDEIVQTRKEQVAIDHGPVLADHTHTPEQQAMSQQQVQLMAKILRGMSERDREILTRFYIREQSQEQICDEMNLTETQYRLLKSRAKARFGEMGRRILARDRGERPRA